MIGTRRTFESVVTELRKGLENGTIVLEPGRHDSKPQRSPNRLDVAVAHDPLSVLLDPGPQTREAIELLIAFQATGTAKSPTLDELLSSLKRAHLTLRPTEARERDSQFIKILQAQSRHGLDDHITARIIPMVIDEILRDQERKPGTLVPTALAILFAISILGHFLVIAILGPDSKAATSLNTAFNAVFPVLTGLLASALTYYFSKADQK